jgi:hypothetical protein
MYDPPPQLHVHLIIPIDQKEVGSRRTTAPPTVQIFCIVKKDNHMHLNAETECGVDFNIVLFLSITALKMRLIVKDRDNNITTAAARSC